MGDVMKYIQKVELLQFITWGDERGKLIALEGVSKEVPFDIKRMYYIFDTTPGTVRGHHAHKTLKQVLVCVSGSCTIVCDDGNRKTEYHLDWPDKGLLIEGMVWHNMKDFSKGAVLLVLASDHYDESDYVRDYHGFLKILRTKKDEPLQR